MIASFKKQVFCLALFFRGKAPRISQLPCGQALEIQWIFQPPDPAVVTAVTNRHVPLAPCPTEIWKPPPARSRPDRDPPWLCDRWMAQGMMVGAGLGAGKSGNRSL